MSWYQRVEHTSTRFRQSVDLELLRDLIYILFLTVDEKQQLKENTGTSAPANKVKDVVRQQDLEKKSAYKKDNNSFDFNRFLEQMKHKSTQSIAKYVKRLVFNDDNILVEHIPILCYFPPII